MDIAKCEFYKKVAVCYSKYFDSVVSHIRTIVFDDELSKEIAQECFLRIFSRSIKVDPDELGTKTYIFSIAKNIGIDYLRRQRMENSLLKEKYYSEAMPVFSPEINQPLEYSIFENEINRIVASSMQEFHEAKQYVFKETVVRGKGIANVSNRSSLSRYKIKKYHKEIVDRLREDLEEYRYKDKR